jgi:lactoylglutathione lyase
VNTNDTPRPPVLDTVRRISACLSVSDLDASVRWYTERMGFAEVVRQDFPELHARLAYLRHGDLILELVQSSPTAGVTRPAPPGHTVVRGITQISLHVDDAKAAMREAEAAELPLVTGILEAPQIGVRAFFSQDPDGNLIEFHQADWA